MIDIITAEDGEDLKVFDTETQRAANILAVQLGSLEYGPEIGIDLNYFLTESLRFQNESFQSYLIEVLANRGINVTSVISLIETLSTTLTIDVQGQETSTALISR